MKEFKWIDYDTWQFYKNGYKTEAQIMRERIAKYLKENPGVMAQLKWVESHPGEASVLTEEMLNEFIESLKFNETNKE
jgi:hypothetical protein